MIRLIGCDMDGTLLQKGHKHVSAQGLELIDSLASKGVIFVIASGRQYTSLKKLMSDIVYEPIYICENGGLIKYKGKTLFKSHLDRELGIELMKSIYNRNDSEMLLSGEETSYVMEKSQSYIDHLINDVGNSVTTIKTFDQVKEEFIKISVYKKDGIKNSKDYFEERWGDKFKVTVSGECWMDFVPKNINKGIALKMVQEELGISPYDTITFGDNYNDLEMFAVSEYSYVMEIAEDEVKNMAKYIVPNVESILSELVERN